MKKVLIIGANSYIGQKFNNFVENNNIQEIQTTMVSASNGAWKSIDFTQFDVVLLLSAIVHKKEKKSMKELYFKVNHKLAVEIANYAKSSGVKQFIFMSTAAVYGKTTGCITNNTKTEPCSFYGMSKLAAENDIRELKNEKFKIAILRPPMVYGEGCKGNYTKLLKAVKFMPIFPAFHNRRSAVYIESLIKYLITIIVNSSEGIFFPQDDEYLDTCNLVVNERKKLGKRTYLFTFLPISFMIKRISLFSKIFGDFYYSKDML